MSVTFLNMAVCCVQRSVALQRESLALKRNTFGDLSTEVAETLQLIGGVEMTQGQMKQAHRTMSKVSPGA